MAANFANILLTRPIRFNCLRSLTFHNGLNIHFYFSSYLHFSHFQTISFIPKELSHEICTSKISSKRIYKSYLNAEALRQKIRQSNTNNGAYLKLVKLYNFYHFSHTVPALHGDALQIFVSIQGPSQWFPPFNGRGESHRLLLTCCPPPQVRLHSDQCCHKDQLPIVWQALT